MQLDRFLSYTYTITIFIAEVGQLFNDVMLFVSGECVYFSSKMYLCINGRMEWVTLNFNIIYMRW